MDELMNMGVEQKMDYNVTTANSTLPNIAKELSNKLSIKNAKINSSVKK